MNYLEFLLYVISTAYTPGPNNIACMSNAAQHGFKKGFRFNLGVFTGQIGVMFICAAFCRALSKLLPKVDVFMRIIAALYILWLAWKTFRSGTEIGERQTDARYRSGLLLCLLNPKYFFYAIVSMETYVLPYYGEVWWMIYLFAVILAVLGFISITLWSLFGSPLTKLFVSHGKLMNTIFALMLVYCAVRMFLQQLTLMAEPVMWKILINYTNFLVV